MPSHAHLYAIAIGSNRRHARHGPPQRVVEAAIARLERDFGLFDSSYILLNRAVGAGLRDFANAVALVECALEPPDLLHALKAIEREYGRRRGRRWAPRVLDLDIVLWSGGAWHSPGLSVPHIGLAERPFVLGPLAAIAPGWRVSGALNIRHLAARLARKRPRG